MRTPSKIPKNNSQGIIFVIVLYVSSAKISGRGPFRNNLVVLSNSTEVACAKHCNVAVASYSLLKAVRHWAPSWQEIAKANIEPPEDWLQHPLRRSLRRCLTYIWFFGCDLTGWMMFSQKFQSETRIFVHNSFCSQFLESLSQLWLSVRISV